MNNLTLSPSVVPQDAKLLSDLLAVLTDPKATKARLDQIAAATDAASKRLETEQTERHTALTKRYEAELAAARAAHDQKIAAAQAAFDVQCAARKAEIEKDAADARQLLAKAQADSAAAAELRAALNKRLDVIRSAAEGI